MIKNNPFLSDDENTLANEYSKKGYLIGKIQEKGLPVSVEGLI